MRKYYKFFGILALLSIRCNEVGHFSESVPAAIQPPGTFASHSSDCEGGIQQGHYIFGGNVTPLRYCMKQGQAITGGDIILDPNHLISPQQYESNRDGINNIVFNYDLRHTLWPNGVIPFEVEAGLPNPERVTQAIAHVQSRTGIRFIPRTSETEYVRFISISGDVCLSDIGMTGGLQTIQLAPASYCGVSSTIHEIGHTLGLWHQHQSLSRDAYINIDWSNIRPDLASNFDKISPVFGLDWGVYDYSSIMHYSPYTFAIDPKKPVITKKDGTLYLRPSSGFSDSDIRGIEQLYGTFNFSYANPTPDRTCVSVNEPSDPDTWYDNYLCSNRDFGIRWSGAGSIPGMRCTQINEPKEPISHGWFDNYLCVPSNSPIYFSWSYDGPLPDQKCIPFFDPSDLDTWYDNYLCYEDRRIRWSSAGPIAGMACTQITEPSEPASHTWNDNYLCTDQDYGFRWSYTGPIPGLLCTLFNETADPHTWYDNYLCYPKTSALKPAWSSSGIFSGRYCISVNEPRDPDTWDDNYLCF